MRTKTILFAAFLALATLLTLSSCSTKSRAINELKVLTYDLRDNSANYSIAQWEDAAYRYIDIRKKINKHSRGKGTHRSAPRRSSRLRGKGSQVEPYQECRWPGIRTERPPRRHLRCRWWR